MQGRINPIIWHLGYRFKIRMFAQQIQQTAAVN
jgi:hypothetical protein